MAITNSEYLLQQILNSTNQTNDNLKALKEVLSDNAKNQGRRDRTSGNNSGGRNSNKVPGGNTSDGIMSKTFKNLFGEAKNFGTTLAGSSATASNVLGSLTTSSKVLTGAFKGIPGPVGAAATAFDLVVDAGMAVYNYMEQQLKMYNELNSAGLMLADGMRTVQRGAGSSLMSLNEFSAVLSKNSDSLAAMDGQYGNGIEHFGNLLNSVQKLESINATFGVSQQQLADLAAKNYKYERMYAGNAQMRQLSETQSTANFVNSMTYLSKTVGKSVDSLLGKFDDMGQNLDSQLAVGALVDRFGKTQENAAEIEKGMNATFASMGDVGQILQKMNSSFMKFGTLPEDFDSQFSQMIAQRMQEMQSAGIVDPKEIQKRINKFIDANKDMLDIEIKNQAAAGNLVQADWLSKMKNLQQLQNQNAGQPQAVWEQMTKTFDNWISNTFTKPFNQMYADTQDKVGRYLLDVANNTDGVIGFVTQLIKDGFSVISGTVKWLLDKAIAIPKTLGEILFGNFDKVEDAFGNLYDDILQIPAAIGNLIMNLISGNSFSNSTAELNKNIHSLFSRVGDIFKSFGELSFDSTEIKKRITSMYDSIKNKLTGWWDSAKGWFSSDKDSKSVSSPLEERLNKQEINTPPISKDEMRKTPPVSAPPPITPTAKVDAAKDEQPQDSNINTTTTESPVDVARAILKSLQTLVSSTDSTSQQYTEALGYFRQIAENTAEGRNL